MSADPADDTPRDLVPIGDVLATIDEDRCFEFIRAAKVAAKIVLRTALEAHGANMRECRLCGDDVAEFQNYHGRYVVFSVSTGDPHYSDCRKLSIEQRSRLHHERRERLLRVVG